MAGRAEMYEFYNRVICDSAENERVWHQGNIVVANEYDGFIMPDQ